MCVLSNALKAPLSGKEEEKGRSQTEREHFGTEDDDDGLETQGRSNLCMVNFKRLLPKGK
jgi:hypothetical protein